MKRIGQIIQRTETKPVARTVWDEKSIHYAFQRVVRDEYGAQGIKNLKPDYWNGKELFVKAESATFGAELRLNVEHIRSRLNRELGGQYVTGIKIKK